MYALCIYVRRCRLLKLFFSIRNPVADLFFNLTRTGSYVRPKSITISVQKLGYQLDYPGICSRHGKEIFQLLQNLPEGL